MTTTIISLINNSSLPVAGIIAIPSAPGKLKTWELSHIKEVILENGNTTLGVVLSTPAGEQVELPLGESVLVEGNQLLATQEEGPEGLEMIELKIITGVEEA